jgi:cell division septation protein DedD
MFVGGTYRPEGRRQRLFTRQRRRFGRGWIVVVAFVAFVALAWLWAFQRGPDSTPSTVPTLHADNPPTRKKPDDPGGLKVADIDPLAYDGRAGPRVERLLPPPESPLPRPAADAGNAGSADAATSSDETPAPVPQMMTPIPVAADGTVGPPVQLVPPRQNQNQNSAPASNAAPAAKPIPAATQAPKPTPAAPPAATTAATPTNAAVPKPVTAPVPVPAAPSVAVSKPAAPLAPGEKGYRVQLASVRSADAAKATWVVLKREHAGVLGALAFSVMTVDLPDRGTYYRVMAGPMSQSAANQVCDEMKRQGAACILVK